MRIYLYFHLWLSHVVLDFRLLLYIVHVYTINLTLIQIYIPNQFSKMYFAIQGMLPAMLG